ncbi:hypothetical protein J0H58_20285 [bacterium]|nr:hypothetical protein [bacterium]
MELVGLVAFFILTVSAAVWCLVFPDHAVRHAGKMWKRSDGLVAQVAPGYTESRAYRFQLQASGVVFAVCGLATAVGILRRL